MVGMDDMVGMDSMDGMTRAIGFLELNSIAKGIEAADAMLKAAQVEMYLATPACPGKYVALISGGLDAVQCALSAGIACGGEYVIDDLVLPNVAEQVFPAIVGTPEIEHIGAIGVIESLSIASLIVAANAASAAAEVQLVEIRLGSGIGGKSYVTITGAASDVEAAVASGVAAIQKTGNILTFTVIAKPHEDLGKILI
jgi:microcompartment protein CcmL/EutN